MTNFEKKVKAELNKTEQEKQSEAIKEFVENSQIDCETQLALLKTSELPKAEQQLKKAELELQKAKKAFEKSRFTMTSDFESYVKQREEALDNVEYYESLVNDAKNAISNVSDRIATFEEILADLS